MTFWFGLLSGFFWSAKPLRDAIWMIRGGATEGPVRIASDRYMRAKASRGGILGALKSALQARVSCRSLNFVL